MSNEKITIKQKVIRKPFDIIKHIKSVVPRKTGLLINDVDLKLDDTLNQVEQKIVSYLIRKIIFKWDTLGIATIERPRLYPIVWKYFSMIEKNQIDIDIHTKALEEKLQNQKSSSDNYSPLQLEFNFENKKVAN